MTDVLKLRIGTRGSPLALAQANAIADGLAERSGGAVTGEIVTFTTSGDQLTSERLVNSGGKGLFTKELDLALDRGEVDLTVHSLKDVPVALPPGQRFVAFPPREDARDGFISPHGKDLASLPRGAKVGTASLRREAQTRAARPDLEIVTFRGNVQTRLRKLDEGLADATYLAMAGLNRLGMAHVATPIPLEVMLPAAAQGIVGVVARDDLAEKAVDVLTAMNDPHSEAAALIERAYLAALDGSCRTPISAHTFDGGDVWKLSGEVLSVDGLQRWSAAGECAKGLEAAELVALGRRVAADILAQAGGQLPAFEGEW